MSRLESIIDKYSKAGVTQENLAFALDSVKDGSKREHILENLTADYRGMEYGQADLMLSELFAVTGGEFKKENRRGYLIGAFFLICVGLPCTIYIAYVLIFGGVIVRPILIGLGALGGLITGIRLIASAAAGKYRDSMNPLDQD